MVSIVVTERERVGLARESLLSILRYSEEASEILYVGGPTPGETGDFLRRTRGKNKKLKLILRNRRLGSNEARNIGWKAAHGKNDLVFVENDVVVRKGWLNQLIRCAKETNAGLVAPLTLEGPPDSSKIMIHDAGARFARGRLGGRRLVHLLHKQEYDGRRLQRDSVDVVEYHCLFVKRRLLEKIGFDEKLGELAGHLDFCFECKKKGAEIVVEPKARVVFVNPVLVPGLGQADLRFFLERWNEEACKMEMSHISKKQGIHPWAHYFWEKRGWAVMNKAAVFGSFGVLVRPEIFLWEITRKKWFPEWFRGSVEKYMVERVFAGMGWPVS